MTAAIELLKVRMQQLAAELGSTLEIAKRPRTEARPELTPPFITDLMKIKPVKDYWDKAYSEMEKQYKDKLDKLNSLEDFFVRQEYKGFLIVFKGTPNEYGESGLESTVNITLLQDFHLNLQYKPEWLPLPQGPSVSKRLNPDSALWKFVLPPKIIQEWRTSPEIIYKVKFNLPPLNDRYITSCSHRKVGEDFLNDWRVRECFLKATTLSYSIGSHDLFNNQLQIRINSSVVEDEPMQLQNIANLTRLSIDLFADWGIIGPG